jgi:vacuolar-type H+-ATPase subunit C/Vma6
LRSQFLTKADYENLLARQKIEEMITALTETPYKDDIEQALVRVGGIKCVFEALRMNLTRQLRQVREFYEGPPRILVDIILRRWDRHNLLTILRGQSQEVSAEVVLSTLIPVGLLDEVSLRELARQPGLRATLDLMTTWRLPYAQPLRQVRARAGPVPDLDQLELALNRFHYSSLFDALKGRNGNQAIVLEHLQIEVDLINLRTALRLARLPELTHLVQRRYNATDICPLLVEPGGSLPAKRLARLVSEAQGVEGIVRELADTRYGPALDMGWRQYGAEGLATIERALERWQAKHFMAMFNRNPLSMAIPIGYFGCKELEVVNLRLIAQAVTQKLQREQVRQNLMIG